MGRSCITQGLVFKRFVEIGRVAVINYGPDAGKLCVIIDVLDQNRAIPFKRLALTDLKIKIQKSPRLKSLVKAYTEAGIQEKWEATSWAKKIALRKKRAALNDFDRFKIMLAKKEKSRVVRQELRKLTKEFHKKENDARVAAKKQ
ncbi:ribosomal protein L14, putative [Acanthamoeba castellanii str. Neff]|uniref:Ribosomal protein L14, putative n=1 Tax=Acanthamoeba castellanii (strain ATCC 30010 / Neff) TaxID=1257118 RepID=L8H418_ACACF|nr:ribosomal protein L14, putative [Acanthamoeba castellanii str. Neff]ELR19468.1 ribosomal protein L14, putative [Acanthamoeba castellanii str. Neff]